jgi:hypothetical protein
MRVVLGRVNNPGLVSIYPAPLQWIFALPALLVPAGAPVDAQVAAMKGWLALFELAALAALLGLLRRLGLAGGLIVVYAWCPLVLKELHNSGHLDAVPGLFVVLAAWAAALARGGGPRARLDLAALAGAALGTAVAAKLYAALLVPLFLRRLGGRAAALFALAALAAAVPWALAFPEGAPRRAATLAEFALSWDMHSAAFLWIERALAALLGEGAERSSWRGGPAPRRRRRRSCARSSRRWRCLTSRGRSASRGT